MGALVTLELPADSPAIDLPWIITFGPLDEDDEWEPVVCGPYERPHALALAESVVADEELMAVVEPLQPHVTIDQIRGDIAAARLAAEAQADDDEEFDEDEYEEFEDDEYEEEEGDGPVRAAVDDTVDDTSDDDSDDDSDDGEFEDEYEDEYDEDEDETAVEPSPPPTPEEIRAGFARIAAKLTGSAG